MFVRRRAVFMSVATMLVGGNSVLFGFGVTAVIVMMSCFAMMVSGVFVMRRRLVMMFAGRMFSFCHNNLLGFFIGGRPKNGQRRRKETRDRIQHAKTHG
jgi:hypothetical protein